MKRVVSVLVDMHWGSTVAAIARGNPTSKLGRVFRTIKRVFSQPKSAIPTFQPSILPNISNLCDYSVICLFIGLNLPRHRERRGAIPDDGFHTKPRQRQNALTNPQQARRQSGGAVIPSLSPHSPRSNRSPRTTELGPARHFCIRRTTQQCAHTACQGRAKGAQPAAHGAVHARQE
jgi:hypothetical protein